MPSECTSNFEDMFKLFCKLDGDDTFSLLTAATIKGASLSARMPIGKSRYVTAHATVHRVPAVAYVVWETKRVLLAEWRGRRSLPLKIRASRSFRVTTKLPSINLKGSTSMKR
jgi:hypothetical protein